MSSKQHLLHVKKLDITHTRTHILFLAAYLLPMNYDVLFSS